MKIINFLGVVILLSLFVSAGSSDEIKRTAIVNQVSGEVMVKNPGPGSWAPAKIGDILNEGSFLKTGAGARAAASISPWPIFAAPAASTSSPPARTACACSTTKECERKPGRDDIMITRGLELPRSDCRRRF